MRKDDVTSIDTPMIYCRKSSEDCLDGLAGRDNVDNVTPNVTRRTDIYIAVRLE